MRLQAKSAGLNPSEPFSPPASSPLRDRDEK